MSYTNYHVKCHSGYTYAQRPVSFEWENVRYAVHSVIAEWVSPEGKLFRVLTDKELAFDLCYAVQADAWTIKRI